MNEREFNRYVCVALFISVLDPNNLGKKDPDLDPWTHSSEKTYPDPT